MKKKIYIFLLLLVIGMIIGAAGALIKEYFSPDKLKYAPSFSWYNDDFDDFGIFIYGKRTLDPENNTVNNSKGLFIVITTQIKPHRYEVSDQHAMFRVMRSGDYCVYLKYDYGNEILISSKHYDFAKGNVFLISGDKVNQIKIDPEKLDKCYLELSKMSLKRLRGQKKLPQNTYENFMAEFSKHLIAKYPQIADFISKNQAVKEVKANK